MAEQITTELPEGLAGLLAGSNPGPWVLSLATHWWHLGQPTAFVARMPMATLSALYREIQARPDYWQGEQPGPTLLNTTCRIQVDNTLEPGTIEATEEEPEDE